MARHSLDGKVAVVTGGNSGIGLATATLLRSHGAAVAIIGRDPVTLERGRTELGGDTLALRADVARPVEIASAMGAVRERWNRIDILFANAGITTCPPILDTDEPAFDRLIGVNLKGVFFTFTKALPLMTRGASAIFTCSAAHELGRPGVTLYAASKAAVRSLARTLSVDENVARLGVRVNVISPGCIRTPLTEPAIGDPSVDEWLRSAVPMARWGTAEEVARAVLFLASDDSSYMTGSEMAVDGGLAQI
jgi:NAD(P)-dependent dehydrogenase (short-subunit alcohol dehydrogenase family)